ncbi:MAG: hypothetical protein KAR39_01090 [Thermoplasmata archaeon]|nr:hypothetical protein [Thermoplasmata archaeon]
MKRILLALLAAFMLAAPVMSYGSVATLEKVVNFKTGVKVEGTYVEDARVNFELEACRWVATYYVISIEYRSTSPPKARPGGFEDYEPPTVGREFVPHPDQEGVPYMDVQGTWYGYAEFTSFINEDASKGTNHGDIFIHYPGKGYTCDEGTCTPEYGYLVYWSFNILHTA